MILEEFTSWHFSFLTSLLNSTSHRQVEGHVPLREDISSLCLLYAVNSK